MTFTGCLCPCYSFWTAASGFLTLGNFGSEITHFPGCFYLWPSFRKLDWTRHIAHDINIKFIFSTRILYRGVPGFAIYCLRGVRCCGLKTCLLYVCYLLEIQFYTIFGLKVWYNGKRIFFIAFIYVFPTVLEYVLISHNMMITRFYLFCYHVSNIIHIFAKYSWTIKIHWRLILYCINKSMCTHACIINDWIIINWVVHRVY